MSDPIFETLNRAADEQWKSEEEKEAWTVNVIAYLRRSRKDHAEGVKPKKEEINLVKALNINTSKTTGTVRRL